MANDDKDDKTKQRKKSDRRGGDRRKGDHETMDAMFKTYGFKDERVEKDPRSGKDRRDEE